MTDRWQERWEKRRRDICANFHKGNHYSVEAYNDLDPDDVKRMKYWILGWIRAQGEKGATCQEVEDGLRRPHQTISARISDMKEMALLVWVKGDSRPTHSGRQAQVYRIASELA